MANGNTIFFHLTDNSGIRADTPVSIKTNLGQLKDANGDILTDKTKFSSSMYDVLTAFKDAYTIKRLGFGTFIIDKGEPTASQVDIGNEDIEITVIAENAVDASATSTVLKPREDIDKDTENGFIKVVTWINLNQELFQRLDGRQHLDPATSTYKYSSFGEEKLFESVAPVMAPYRLTAVQVTFKDANLESAIISYKFYGTVDTAGSLSTDSVEKTVTVLFNPESIERVYRGDKIDVFTYVDSDSGLIPTIIDSDEMFDIVEQVHTIQKAGQWKFVSEVFHDYILDEADKNGPYKDELLPGQTAIKQQFHIFHNTKVVDSADQNNACAIAIKVKYFPDHNDDYYETHWPSLFQNSFVEILPMYDNLRKDPNGEEAIIPTPSYREILNVVSTLGVDNDRKYNIEFVSPSVGWSKATDGLINYPLMVYEQITGGVIAGDRPLSRRYKGYNPGIEPANSIVSTETPSFTTEEESFIWKLGRVLMMADQNIATGKYDGYFNSQNEASTIAKYMGLRAEIDDTGWSIIFTDSGVNYRVRTNTQNVPKRGLPVDGEEVTT